MSGYEPRFDADFSYGRQGELLVDGIVEGLRKGTLRWEVKRKRRLDSKLYVELEHDPHSTGQYKPSGLATTEADAWGYVVHDTNIVIWIPTVVLKDAVAGNVGFSAEEYDGDNPTRGRLIDLEWLLSWIGRHAPSDYEYEDIYRKRRNRRL